MVKYQVSILVQKSSDGTKVGDGAVSSSSDVDTIECRNCKHFISSRSIALHEVYGSRHTVVCNHLVCGRIVLSGEEAKNFFNIKKEPRDSPLRLIAYRFRGDMVEAGNSAADVRDRMREISEHESTYLWFMATGKGS
ncbi:hypothetical protein IGI04_002009 [Brassica rapa subsp. trilocularis]|uniref:Yippee domain-containing protein n=1 Tax=Brassica rapa subsp. trilocularis TaxID=1813537 RepID=A0ABQ7NUB9_BRACM|nr:hypothetical protein IGI04_002009 [Brassica rapa subsp. trilocularis]